MPKITKIPNFDYYADKDGNIYRKLKPRVAKSGYAYLALYKNSVPYYRLVHRLVVETFIGIIQKGLHVCHNDGNPTNNKLENLRIDTPKGNAKDRIRHKTDTRGEKNTQSKLKSGEVWLIRRLNQHKIRGKFIASMFKITAGHISAINTYKAWPS